MMLKNDTTVTENFDEFYVKPDPWSIRNSVQELARIRKFKEVFRNCRFEFGLDIGCGEGHFTSTMDWVSNLTAVDISSVALQRAKSNYPEINFKISDLRNLSEIESNKYDFISCLESIYYLSVRERERALTQIKEKGKDNCVFCFSVVTIGENEHRKYFNYEEAVSFFASEFNIVSQFPISLIYTKPNLFVRTINKVCRRIIKNKNDVEKYLKEINSVPPQSAYQNVFILTKKSENI